jgi:hypothetical protein
MAQIELNYRALHEHYNLDFDDRNAYDGVYWFSHDERNGTEDGFSIVFFDDENGVLKTGILNLYKGDNDFEVTFNEPITTYKQFENLLAAFGFDVTGLVIIRDEYFIQDTRSIVGNCCLWWALGRAGYTTDIDKAEVFTKAEAERICAERSTDKMYLAQSIRFGAKRMFDSQYLPK